MRDGRTSCCVPFCRRTTAGAGIEWVCNMHWPKVPKPLKERLQLARRIRRRAELRFQKRFADQGDTYTPEQWRRVEAARGLAARAWDRCRDAAIQSAIGV